MGVESETSVLVSNIIDENNYSHCRLCLKCIVDENFARFQDSVAFSSANDFLLLDEVLTKLFGKEACNEIPGVDAVCNNCLDKTLEMLSLIHQYENSTLKLNKVLDNLNAKLNTDIGIPNKNQVLYIVCGEEESQLVFIQNIKEAKKPVQKKLFRCFKCRENFDRFDLLERHNEINHNTYTCKKCTYTSKNDIDLVEHEMSVELYKCKECPQSRCTEESLKEHEGIHSTFMCKQCGKSYKGLDKLLAHEDKHENKNECPKCGKAYTTKQFFVKHVKLCLENRFDPHPMRSKQKKPYFCPKCGKGYSTAGSLRVHLRFVHGNAKPHVCEQCGKKFTAPCYLKAHMVTHTKEKNFPCDLCEGKFVSREALLYHRRRHTGEKPYSCDTCDEKFVNASARAEHIKFKHVGPTLSCELCSRMFVTKYFLRLHMKKHHDPTNKLYIGRTNIPPNVPGELNMRVRIAQ